MCRKLAYLLSPPGITEGAVQGAERGGKRRKGCHGNTHAGRERAAVSETDRRGQSSLVAMVLHQRADLTLH